MGITISYALRSRVQSVEKARALVTRMRDEAVRLRFEEVGEVREVPPEVLGRSAEDIDTAMDGDAALLRCLSQRVMVPWTVVRSRGEVVCAHAVLVRPVAAIYVATMPTDGCESAWFGLARYPKQTSAVWNPEDDRRFQVPYAGGWEFSWDRWLRHAEKHGLARLPAQHRQRQVFPTHLHGWYWHDSCKTEYADNPERGGPANYLHGHIGLVAMLDRMNGWPGLSVSYHDEAGYGATEDGPGRYDIAALLSGDAWQALLEDCDGVLDTHGGDVDLRPLWNACDGLPHHPAAEPLLAALEAVAARARDAAAAMA